jgi:Domain of unknown function (DUF4399)
MNLNTSKNLTNGSWLTAIFFSLICFANTSIRAQTNAQESVPSRSAAPPITSALTPTVAKAPISESEQTLSINHRWVLPPQNLSGSAYFTNLSNGDKVTSPFVVQFGMSFFGIVPAEHKHPKTGHHHLLVDTPLPIPPSKSIPFNKNHIHFGKGQMETVLDLPPGPHTLRLLLADHQHIPLSVFSPEITVHVAERDEAKAEILKNRPPQLSFPNLNDGDTVSPRFRVMFHASGLNIANSLTQLPNTGYFQLRITKANKTDIIAFPTGQTEAWFQMPAGQYSLQLEYLQNPKAELHPAKSKLIRLNVRE